MSTELVRHGGPSPALARSTLGERMQYADALANAGLLPPAYRKQPANVLLAIEQGEALGIHHLAAINGIHVIDGKPTLSAELMRALILRDGHRFDVIESSAEKAVIEAARRERPETIQRFEWTKDDTVRAGLANKDTHKKYPAALNLARATSAAARAVFPDVIAGMGYTPEELGAEVTEDGRVIEVTAPRAFIEAHRTPEPTGREKIEWEMFDLFGRVGLGGDADRDARRALVSEILGRPVANSRDLSDDEAETVVTDLRRRADAMPQEPVAS